MSRDFESIENPAAACFPERAARWERIASQIIEKRKNSYTVTVKYPLPPPFLSLDNVKIAFVSDLHYTANPRCRAILDEIVSEIEKENCNILLLGGDICGDSSHLKYLPEVLNRLSRCAERCFAIPGNWERGKLWLGMEYWRELYEKNNITFLCNQTACFNGISITGTDDCGKGSPELPGRFSADHCNILLTHRPDTAVYLDHDGGQFENCHLAVCGHTHAGQIKFIRGLLPASKYGWKFDHGTFRHILSNTVMYVSAGLGELSFPFRFNTQRELLIFGKTTLPL